MHGKIYIADALELDHPLNREMVAIWKILSDQQRGVIHRDLRGHRNVTLGSGFSRPSFDVLAYTGLDTTANINSIVVDDFTAQIVMKSSGDSIPLVDSDSYPQLRVNNPSNTMQTADPPNVNSVTSSTLGVALTNWSTLTWVRSGNSINFYQNGLSYGSGTFINTASWNRFMAYSATVMYVKDFRFFKRAFSESEVSQLYQEQLRGSPETLRWIKRKTYSFADVAGGNRRRRVICGAA